MKKTLIACGILACSSGVYASGFSFSHFGYDNTTQYVTNPAGTHVATLHKNASGGYLIDAQTGASTWSPQNNNKANPVTTNSAGANLSKNVELELKKGVLKEAKKVNHSQAISINKGAIGRGLGKLARFAGPLGLGLALLDLLKDAQLEPNAENDGFDKATQVPYYPNASFNDSQGVTGPTPKGSPSAVCSAVESARPVSWRPYAFQDQPDTPHAGSQTVQYIGRCVSAANGNEVGVIYNGTAQTQSQLSPVTDTEMDTLIENQITNPKMAPAVQEALGHPDVSFEPAGTDPASFTAGPAVTTTPTTTSTSTTHNPDGSTTTEQTQQHQSVMGTASGNTINNASIAYNITNIYNTTTNGQLTNTTTQPAEEPAEGPIAETPAENDTLTGGQNCNSPPACSGSPIECYQASELWKHTCAYQVPEKQQLEDKIEDGLETTVEGGLLQEKASINVTDWITGAGTGGGCISDVQIFVQNVNQSINVPLSHACKIVELLRALFLIGTALHCLRALTEAF